MCRLKKQEFFSCLSYRIQNIVMNSKNTYYCSNLSADKISVDKAINENHC